ncbi:EAL domain-containing protein [Roseospira marina]|uniref:EAL domain-containing protein n=1 Tax=Roseospira marina TaxID=140057 RepID=A0A5M6IGS0_9PROT|nr:EAL domain-containing protein [Roseospira marina]KAA5607352.1 EAL domain-containing protein [Roseospira marina]MBB4312481.1 hypothetical protein [Roseospira marina]MBB5085503.1 hypothetical protein [Roseospira marina]
MAAHLFEPLVTGYGAEVFLLSNGDLVVLGRDVPATALETHVERLRALFRTDPASRAESEDGEDLFATAYDLEGGSRDLRVRVTALRSGGIDPWRVMNRTQPQKPDRALEPRPLLQITQALDRLDPRQLIRRQPIVRIDAERRGTIVCEEFYTALAEVRRHCAPDLDMRANRWLFQEACRLLDPRTIAAIAGLAPSPRAGVAIGLNLTLETVLGAAFDRFLAALPPKTRLIVDISVIDAFTNLDLVPRAWERLRSEEHALCLDAVDPRALAMIDPGRLPVDHIKLVWSDDLAEASSVWDGPHPDVLLRALGPDRTILTRVENDRAMMWGLKNNIRTFQGFFVDHIVGATTMAGCPKSQACTLAQCVDRRRAATGAAPTTCPNPPQLTAVTDFRAMPGRSSAQAPPPASAAKGGAHG